MASDSARAAHQAVHEQRLRATIVSVIETWDVERCGSLDRHHAKCAFVALMGAKPSKVQFNLLMAPKNKGAPEDRVSWQHFTDSMLVLMTSTRDPDEHIRQIFRSFDTESCGYISRRAAHAAFKNVMPTIDSRVVDQVFDELDTDRDSRVSARELIAMMQQQVVPGA